MESNKKDNHMHINDELKHKILQRDKIKQSLMSDNASSDDEIEFLLKRL